jgi:hypothetical protein
MRKTEPRKIYVLTFLLCCVMGGLAFARSASYTARTLIRVLPYPDRDPTVIQSPAFDRETQNQFCRSLAKLMRQEKFLTDLLVRDAVKNTSWFKRLGKDSKLITPEILSDLEKNLQVTPSENADFIEVSMRCTEPQDAADIVNEAVDLFVAQQRDRRVSDVRNRLVELEKRRQSLEHDVDLAGRALDAVRSQYGFTDLEKRDYPFPPEVRLNRLHETKDKLAIDLTEAQALADYAVRSNQDPNEQQQRVMVCRAKLEQAEKMLAEASTEKWKLDLACAEYQQRARIREQIQFQLDQIKTLIEKHRILAEDPETSKVQGTSQAVAPLRPDSE